MTSPSPHPSDRFDALVAGRERDPHALLGAHVENGLTIVRTFRPDASGVSVLAAGYQIPMELVHVRGVFEAALSTPPVDYRLEVSYLDGEDDSTYIVDDPYRWLPTLGDMDEHLIAEGRHEKLWTVLGAHVRTYDTPGGSVSGVSFAVWAPSALGIRITGDFDFWQANAYSMRLLGATGVWELFIPGVELGARYKFNILGADGVWRVKADPMAFGTEIPPATASVVTASDYAWQDDEWMTRRSETSWHNAPMSIYEVHLGSWRKGLDYRQLADELVDYLVQTGFTHAELLPVSEHPFGGSWGYQVTSYYAPSARFGSPDDFRYLVDRLHQAGIGILVDWVPAHFPKDEWALARFDGTPLYEHADPRRGEQPDWGTYVFDFGRREVRNFLVANALYWLQEYHIDGLRVDAVASMLYLDYSREAGEWTPNIHGGRENLEAVTFLREMNERVYGLFPGAVTIAEESTSFPGITRPTYLGGIGFGFKWDMGWMHDTLEYFSEEPIHRRFHHDKLTFRGLYVGTEQFVLPLSHDEVVHGKGSLLRKMPGDDWQRFANLRALLVNMWGQPGKKLLFMGAEMAPWTEWSHDHPLPWELQKAPMHGGVTRFMEDLGRVYLSSPSLWAADHDADGFAWIDASDVESSVYAWIRRGGDDLAVVVLNLTPVPRHGYRLGLPISGRWVEALNSDSEHYGGSNLGNLGGVVASDEPWHGQPASALLTLPPLSGLILRPSGE
ncbi:MAG: 1,4-alpha-glucan branching protein GlgB [Geodermatophilaceae bacterium]|nr:1,4-alpha-glucan branching protein GlgB [Geodermatophilaceae bacterium]